MLDTNVWVSGLHFAKLQSAPTRAIIKAMSEDTLATCAEIEDEIFRVLTEKFHWQPAQTRAALRSVLERAVRVRLDHSFHVCRDPNDDIFLECALRAGADLLVAGDKDLLVLKEVEGIRILSPAAYVGQQLVR